MISQKLKQLAALKAQTAILEEQVVAERNKELAALPGQFGFRTLEEFIAAFRAAATSGPVRKPTIKVATSVRRRRAKITDEMRAEVKKMVNADKTGVQIAKALRISLPSVQNIKKALGLVKARK